MLGQRLRRWPNIESALVLRLVVAGLQWARLFIDNPQTCLRGYKVTWFHRLHAK